MIELLNIFMWMGLLFGFLDNVARGSSDSPLAQPIFALPLFGYNSLLCPAHDNSDPDRSLGSGRGEIGRCRASASARAKAGRAPQAAKKRKL